jgi:DNA repair exonuclease SbcCD ATPase subunit
MTLSPRFGFFKKKNNLPEIRPSIRGNRMTKPIDISVTDALAELAKIESVNVRILSNNLSPIKEDVTRTLRSIQKVADDLEKDNIKLEEDRFKSIVQNSKATVISSLKREASSLMPLPQSAYDAKRFKEKLESIVNRFGEVSGSHSKVFNIFMKKYVGKLKDEFERLSSLLEDTKSIITDYEEKAGEIVECSNLLNTISQKTSSVKSNNVELENTNRVVEKLEIDLQELKNALKKLEDSAEFKEIARTLSEIDKLKVEEEEFHKQLLDLFGHLSRAITKYSYGMNKETYRRLHVLSDEPWKIFEEAEGLSPYIKLLYEIRKSVELYDITLKDSDKVIQYCDVILKSLPQFQETKEHRRQRLELLYKNNADSLFKTSAEIKERIQNDIVSLQNNKRLMEQLPEQINETNHELENLTFKAEECLLRIIGKKFRISK